MPAVQINGFTMYYETLGEGFPLLYIHGGFGGLGTGGNEIEPPSWRDRFAEHFKVITYDRRAAGRSSYPAEGFMMQNFAKDARELLRYLGHDRAHIWGVSAGGQITLAFGLEYPEAAASLVIVDSAPWLLIDKERQNKLRERIRVLKEKGPDAAYEERSNGGTVGLDLFSGRPVQSEEDKRSLEERRERIRAYLRQISREERVAKYASELHNYSAYVDWDATPRLKEMVPHTLVVYGTEDSVFPAQGSHSMVQLIPNIEYKVFQGAEHGVVQFPETLELVLSFLRRHTPGGA